MNFFPHGARLPSGFQIVYLTSMKFSPKVAKTKVWLHFLSDLSCKNKGVTSFFVSSFFSGEHSAAIYKNSENSQTSGGAEPVSNRLNLVLIISIFFLIWQQCSSLVSERAVSLQSCRLDQRWPWLEKDQKNLIKQKNWRERASADKPEQGKLIVRPDSSHQRHLSALRSIAFNWFFQNLTKSLLFFWLVKLAWWS